MPDSTLTHLGRAACWLIFFATSVYGHVALKVAVDRTKATSALGVASAAWSWWGISAYVAWGLSCIAWMMVLSGSGLLRASSISAMSYVLICLSAILFLGEPISWTRMTGALLITSGIFLIK